MPIFMKKSCLSKFPVLMVREDMIHLMKRVVKITLGVLFVGQNNEILKPY